MKFKQAVKLLDNYAELVDLCYKLAKIKLGREDLGYAWSIEQTVGGIEFRFEDVCCGQVEFNSVVLPPIAFDDTEAWIKGMK